MFCAGASFVTGAHSCRTCDWVKSKDLVDGLLASYPTPGGGT